MKRYDKGLTVYEFGLKELRLTLAAPSYEVALGCLFFLYDKDAVFFLCMNRDETAPLTLLGKDLERAESFFGKSVSDYVVDNCQTIRETMRTLIPGRISVREEFWKRVKEKRVPSNNLESFKSEFLKSEQNN